MGIERRLPLVGLLLAAVALVSAGTSVSAADSGANHRAPVAKSGEANQFSMQPRLSADGRYVAFTSAASNLVAGDTNDAYDVFVHDRESGEMSRVSVASDGTQADEGSWAAAISADGRYVTFDSLATNLVEGDTGWWSDEFVHDRQTGVTTQVSVASDGTRGNEGSGGGTMSADGRYVAFMSVASNLVAGDTNAWIGGPAMNAPTDVFVHDRRTGTTTRVSVATDGTESNGHSFLPVISGDGRYVTFFSAASNLVAGDTNNRYDLFVHDRQTHETTSVPDRRFQTAWGYDISAEGRFVTFGSPASDLVAGDTNAEEDIFVHDRQTGTATRVSVASDGTQSNGWSLAPEISADGRYVTFSSLATNLVEGDTNGEQDIFVHDRETGITSRVSVASDGSDANDASFQAAISADGRYVTFTSLASNLVEGDTNQHDDIFVHDRSTGVTTRVSVGASYRLVAADGGVFSFGDATFHGSTGNVALAEPIVGMAATPAGRGYWLVAADGGVFSFGDATFHGSMGNVALAQPIVGMAATPTGRGYWLVAADGGVFSFGDATFHGSMGNVALAQPIVGMAATPTGRGYWLVAADGGVFSFGDATFHGSTGALTLAEPIVDMAATPTGDGYWLVAADGGAFAFGDATFRGSTAGRTLTAPVVGMAATPAGEGYWLVAADGQIFGFGNASVQGSTSSLALSAPMVSID